MKEFPNVVGGIIVLTLVFVSVCSAQLSDLEQTALHQEAKKLTKDTGLGESDLYRNLVFLHLAKQSQRAAQNATNPIETQHQNLRADLYENAADASLKVAFLIEKSKQLIADLQKEQEVTNGKIVSQELTQRLNAFGTAVTDALLTTAKMSAQMMELASFEATQGCGTQKNGYVVYCLEELQQAVGNIQTAMGILEKTINPFIDAVILGGTKRFTY